MMMNIVCVYLIMIALSWNHMVSALNSTSRAYCRVYPDPHFTTWHGDYYDYHGGCDLVLITNALLDFHIRTQSFTGWSGIIATAIRINGDVFEVQEATNTIYVNTVDVTALPPATIGGYPFTVTMAPLKYRLDLAGGQYIEITETYGSSLQVDVLGHGSDFGDSEGLCANWTADSPNALRGRDGTTVYSLATPNPYGEHWRVDNTMGDPLLFRMPSLAACNYTQSDCDRNGANCQDRVDKAMNACKNVPTERNARDNCEFDVIITNDVGFAQTIAYTSPLIGDPPERCIEVNATSPDGTPGTNNSTSCTKRGGKCVWRCDETKYTCIDELCTGPEPGCSCELPYTKPPTRAPVKPTTKPTTKPPTRPPVKPTNNEPTRAPVKPTRAPTRAPVKPTAPVKPPIKFPPCGVFNLSLFCFNGCGFFGRLFGMCN